MIGGMVVYADAAQELRTLATLDVPLPGISPWGEITKSPRTWRFMFFRCPRRLRDADRGKERQFLSWFHNSEAVNVRALRNEVEDITPAPTASRSVAGRVPVLSSFPKDANASFLPLAATADDFRG